jgi:hypothetical protein
LVYVFKHVLVTNKMFFLFCNVDTRCYEHFVLLFLYDTTCVCYQAG